MADNTSLNDYLQLENINCTDSNGVIYEHYDYLLVRRDVERGHTHPKPSWLKSIFFKAEPASLKIADATFYLEDQGLFLPSFALTCNILAELYAKNNSAKVAKFLNQYSTLEERSGNASHIQNTIVDCDTKQIIHYPDQTDCSVRLDTKRSQQTRKALAFNFTDFKNLLLEDALKDANVREFLQNLTGLQHPEVLVEIGTHFGKVPYIFATGHRGLCATWLGGSSQLYSGKRMFVLNTISNATGYDSEFGYTPPYHGFARGVRSRPGRANLKEAARGI